MANLGVYSINTNGQWKKLSEITGLTFLEGDKYNLQLNKGSIVQFCEKSEIPEENEGFKYAGNEVEPIPYLVESVDLYVKNISQNCTINIAIKE